MKNIFLLFLLFSVSTLKSQDDVYYVETDTIYKKEKKHRRITHLPNYQNSLYTYRNIRRDFYYSYRVSPFYETVEDLPNHLYYYDDIFYTPLRNDYWSRFNSNPVDELNNVQIKPRTTEKIYNNTTKRTPTNNINKPNTSGRKF
jgi:hypothetical protein